MVVGNVVIRLGKAKLKRDTEMFGSMDPYVVINIGENHQYTSKVDEGGGKNPNFKNETWNVKLRQHDAELIEFKLFDKESLQSEDDLICLGEYHLSQIMALPGATFDGKIDLMYELKIVGELNLHIVYNEDTAAIQMNQMKDQQRTAEEQQKQQMMNMQNLLAQGFQQPAQAQQMWQNMPGMAAGMQQQQMPMMQQPMMQQQPVMQPQMQQAQNMWGQMPGMVQQQYAPPMGQMQQPMMGQPQMMQQPPQQMMMQQPGYPQQQMGMPGQMQQPMMGQQQMMQPQQQQMMMQQQPGMYQQQPGYPPQQF